MKTTIEKQKVKVNFKMTEEESISHLLNQVRKENIAGFILKEQSEIESMTVQCAAFKDFQEMISQYKIKLECDQAMNQKITLKKLKTLVNQAET